MQAWFRHRSGLAAGLCLLWVAPALPAAEYVKKVDSATLRLDDLGADARVDEAKNEITLRYSTRPTLTVSIDAPPPLEIEKENTLEEIQRQNLAEGWNFDLKVDRTRITEGRWLLTIKLDPKKPEDTTLKIVDIVYYEGPMRQPRRVSWPEIKVHVTTSVANPGNPSADQMHDITPIEEVPEKATWRAWLWKALGAVGVLLLAIALVLGAWQVVRWRLGQAANLPPDRWALRELDRVEAQKLPDAGQAERYHTLLSDVVRRYLELRFRLRAPQQTTAEFLSTMQNWPLLPQPQQQLLRDFLERCDLAKFAQTNPSPEECLAVGAMARSFVEQTQAAEQKSS